MALYNHMRAITGRDAIATTSRHPLDYYSIENSTSRLTVIKRRTIIADNPYYQCFVRQLPIPAIAPLDACTWKSAVTYPLQPLPYSQVLITRLLP